MPWAFIKSYCITLCYTNKSKLNVLRFVSLSYCHVLSFSCWSMIGRSGGVQKLKLGNWCLQLGTTLHELMHAIGFFHEQSREDRDDHVVIYWSNIQSGMCIYLFSVFIICILKGT